MLIPGFRRNTHTFPQPESGWKRFPPSEIALASKLTFVFHSFSQTSAIAEARNVAADSRGTGWTGTAASPTPSGATARIHSVPAQLSPSQPAGWGQGLSPLEAEEPLKNKDAPEAPPTCEPAGRMWTLHLDLSGPPDWGLRGRVQDCTRGDALFAAQPPRSIMRDGWNVCTVDLDASCVHTDSFHSASSKRLAANKPSHDGDAAGQTCHRRTCWTEIVSCFCSVPDEDMDRGRSGMGGS